MRDLAVLREKLREIQHARDQGGPDEQDAQIAELYDLLEHFSTTLLPSAWYAYLCQPLTYYEKTLLPQLPGLSIQNRKRITQKIHHTLKRLEEQATTARSLEVRIGNILQQLRSGKIRSLQELLTAFRNVTGAAKVGQMGTNALAHDSRTQKRMEDACAMLHTSFTAKQVFPFFETLWAHRILPENERLRLLVLDQLYGLLQMQAVLVETKTQEAHLIRLDINTALKPEPPNSVVFENQIDERMYQSCLKAVQQAHTFLRTEFPQIIANKFLRVTCCFENPLAIYTDTSASLLVGVKVVGDVLNLPIDPSTTLSGEVDDNGRIAPVQHISAKILAAGREPGLNRMLAPEIPAQCDTSLRLIPVTTFDEAVSCYYGRERLRRHQQYQDWRDAPDLVSFVGREEELAMLTRWILRERCRLVAIVGLKGVGKTRLSVKFGKGGIGKTDLSLKLAHNIHHEFDVVIWRSLINAPPLQELLSEILPIVSKHRDKTFAESVDIRISHLLQAMNRQRCLLILDNVETILQSGEISLPAIRETSSIPPYCDGYADYGRLFRQIGEVSHQSCLLLTSREKPLEVSALAGPDRPVRMLELGGLKETAVKAFFNTLGEFSGSEDDWHSLTERYHGNPLALELAAQYIRETFQGRLSDALSSPNPAFDTLYDLLDWHIQRLSGQELEMLYWLTINREAVSEEELSEDLLEPPSIQSSQKTLKLLEHRIPLEHSPTGITLQPVLLEYLTRQLIERIGDEILRAEPDLLTRHALLKATAKDYVRESQYRLILEPILSSWSPIPFEQELTRLLKLSRETASQQPGHYISPVIRRLLPQFQQKLNAILESRETFEAQIVELLKRLHQKSHEPSGYAAGNLLNLLCHLKDELHGYDFSHLPVWQAYLKGKMLHDVNFAHADLSKSVFTQNFGSISSVAFSPDGVFLATGDSQGGVHVWQIATEQLVQEFQGHPDFVRTVAFSSDGSWVASAGDDRAIKLWNLRTGECLHTFSEHGGRVLSVAFSPVQPMLASCGDDAFVRVWDLRTGRLLHTLQGSTAGSMCITFSADGRWLANGGETPKIWESRTGQCLTSLPAHRLGVRSLVFTHDAQHLISASAEPDIRIWNVHTAACLNVLQGHTGALWTIALTGDGKTLVSGGDDQCLKVWDLLTGACLKTLSDHENRITALAASPTTSIIAGTCDEPRVKIWDIQTGNCVTTLQGYTNRVWCLAVSPDGRYFAAGSDDRAIRVWTLQTQTCVQTLRGHTHRVVAVAFSPDGRVLAGAGDDPTIRLWDWQAGKCLTCLKGHAVGVRSVAFSPDGCLLASAGDDWTIRIWDLKTDRCLSMLKGHTDWVRCVVFSPDGQCLASGSNDRTIRLWDIHNNTCLRSLTGHSGSVRSIGFHPSGDRLASGGDEPVLRLWDRRTGACLKLFEGHTNWVMSVAISPDGRIFASGGYDCVIRLWDIATGTCLHKLHGHTNRIRSLAFSPNGKSLISGGADETIKVWDVRTATCLSTVKLPEPYEGMDITGVKGMTPAQKASLKALGAVEQEIGND